VQRAFRMAPAFSILLLLSVAAAPVPPSGSSPSDSPTERAAGSPGAILSGSVVSAGGAGLSGARLTIIRKETGSSRTAASGDRGLYRAAGLAAGSYSVTVELPGFEPAGRDVVLGPGESLTLNFILSPAGFRERVRVTASSPSDSLEAADLRRSAARDVGEALSALPGMWSLRKGGIANDVVVRGLQSQDVTLLIDGERLYGACPNHMDPPAFHVDFAEVGRIDVGKGPFDVRNAGSMGGTVNVLTSPPEPGWHAAPFLAVGPWGYLNPSATLSYAGEGLSALGGISYRVSEPYRDGSGLRFTQRAGYEEDAVADDAYRVSTFWTKLAATPSKAGALQLSYTRQEADHVDYPYLLMDAIYDDTDRARIAYNHTPEADSPRGLGTEVYFTRVHHWMTDQYRLSSAGKPRDYGMGTEATARTLGGRVEGRTDRTTVGLEAFQRLWDASTVMAGGGYAPQRSLPGTRIELAGLYIETVATLSRQWKLEAGARLDRSRSSAAADPAALELYDAYNDTRSTSRTDTLPSAFFRFVLRKETLELSAGAGRSSRVPEPSERYFALHRTGTDWVGNPELRPAGNTGLDLSLSAWRTGLHVTGSLFSYQLENNITVCDRTLVNPVPGVTNTAARSYANTDATLWGGEVSAVATLTGRLFLSGDASFVQGSQSPSPASGILSENLAEVPPQRFRTALRYDTGTWWTEMEGVLSGAQGRVDADLQEEPTPGWAIANLRGGVQRGPLTVTVGVTNLFDRTYHQHLSYQRDPFRSGTIVNEPGRGWFLNAGYRF
jgi:iron complex outermembrane recepter protein